MSSNIIASIQPAKERLVNLLQEINQLEFNGDPKQWRQFWSSFDAAVRSQTIPDIQKLNYLYSCLTGNGLQVVSGYDYGKSSTITTILYKELQSTKGSERDWKQVIENIERVLRQLEALGEEMEHSSIENMIEGKLPRWILNKVYEQKKAERTWSTSKLRELLLEVANMDEQVSKVLNFHTQAESKPTTTKFGQKQRYNPEETSALSTIRSTSQPKVSQPTKNKKRPCIFCNRDHWDSDCDDYPTAKTRLYRLKRLKKCPICFRDNHKGEACKVKKQCFYCKGSHNSALCEQRNIISSENMARWENKTPGNSKHPTKHDSPTLLSNSICTTQMEKPGETLLLCRGINVFNPKQPQRKLKALALFDIGSQLSFISRKLSYQLGLSESETQIMKISPFGTNKPKLCPTTSAQLSIQTQENGIISLRANLSIYQFQDLTSNWEKPDVLIGADYFFKFIYLQEFKELHSGHILLTKVTCSVNVNINSELEKFWKLEMIGIQESPTADDDDQALEHFKQTIIKQDGRYQAFLQIGLQKEERNCTRFLWLNNLKKEAIDENIKCYRFKRVPFGVILSPFLLAATLNYHLESYGSELADEIRKNLYVDNVTISAANTEEALNKYEEMKIIFGEASMNIREFLSNDKEFNERIPYDDLSQTKKENFLGLSWNPKRDKPKRIMKIFSTLRGYYPCDTKTMDRKKFDKEDYSTIRSLSIWSIGFSRSYNDQT
uniref:DUF1758 domain-containing protein n=1 Tax=Wuchereria bancrofti TaxID=6293 RepID=A0AAF5Q6I1_WUCBA